MPPESELARRITDMREDTQRALSEIKELISGLQQMVREDYVSRGEYDTWTDAMERQVSALWDDNRALRRSNDDLREKAAASFRQTVFWAIGTAVSVLGVATALAGVGVALFT